ncbi:MAG: D-glycero-beta-D-manno-heptose 1-phosphate adenylyltransferase [Candidatus Binatia bacterium]
MGRVLDRNALRAALVEERRAGRTIVFTNGCFDLLHLGHVRSLREARRHGDRLVVGLNSDASVRRLGKGSDRPVLPEDDRAEMLAALDMVDYVSIFDEDTPLELIRATEPDVLAKGGDWSESAIVGADFVRARGGRVERLPYHRDLSTTEILRRIRGV